MRLNATYYGQNAVKMRKCFALDFQMAFNGMRSILGFHSDLNARECSLNAKC